MALTPKKSDLTAGLAGQRSETIDPNADPFVTGDIPALFGVDEPLASDTDLPALSVVGFNGSGELIEAVHGTTQAIGILVYAADETSGDVMAHVYRGGCFNPTLVNWPASYDTDEKKRTAFYGAPSPTAIVLRAPRSATIS